MSYDVRWIVFAMLAGLFLVGQTSLAPWVEILSVRPDWMFIFVVYLALYAPGPDAMLGAWGLGLLVDLCADHRMGLFALVYGVCGLALVRLRGALYRGHPLTDVLVTLLATFVAQLLIFVYRLWFIAPTAVWTSLTEAVLTALYTAAWAPYLHWLLRRANRLMGIRTHGTWQSARA